MKSSILKRLIFPCIVIILTTRSLLVSAQTITNGLIRVSFDKATGFLSAKFTDERKIFTGGVFSINQGNEVYTSDRSNYSYQVSVLTGIETGPEMNITGKDRKRNFDFKAHICLSGRINAITIDITYRNSSGSDQVVGSIEPLRLLPENGGRLYYSEAEKCLTNGAMYYDAGMIHNFSETYIKPDPYGETKGGVPLDKVLYDDPYTVQSWWNAGIFSNYHKPFMSVGYLHNANSLGRIQLKKSDNESLALIIESVLNPGFQLSRSGEINSDKIAIIIGDDPYKVLEQYADLMSGEIKKPATSAVNGWCNWFYTMDKFTEDEILKNASFAARVLKPYGLEYIQIDEGYQTLHGEWQGNERFPHGLKWLCDSIKSMGLKPGIWIAPFVISEGTKVYREHPEWLVKGPDGKPKRIGPWPSDTTAWYRNESPKRYCLDVTHPEAERWLRNLFDTIVNDWGFEMIKIDFVAWTLFSADQFYNPHVTPAQAYTKAIKILRETAGDKCHINDCGPGNVSAGLINSMRIEYDQNYGFSSNAWGQYFSGNSSSSGASGKRYFYNNKLWTNDIDHVCIDLLSNTNAEAAATLIGLSGGNTISGDRLMNLGNTKLEVLQKIYPSTIENGKPVDLFDRDPQTVFSCRIKRPFGTWDVIALFNPDRDHSVARTIPLDRLWLEPAKKYLCFDFWNQRFAGEITERLTDTINPGSVSLYSLREKKDHPQILGTNRHVKMGAVEIEDERFDKQSATLHVVSTGPEGSMHSVFIYIPDGFNWSPENGSIYSVYDNFTVRKVEENVMRVDLMFRENNKISWSLKFNR
jgi:hypothetical protein